VRRADLVSAVDVVATLLDYAGVTPLSGRDGVSLRPVFEQGVAHPRDLVIGGMTALRHPPTGDRGNVANWQQAERAYFARSAKWRYVWYVDRNAEELYRIEKDPAEQKDVLSRHRDVGDRMHEEVLAWQAAMRAEFQ